MEEALDSFDESPEIQHEAVSFLVGDALIEINEEENGEKRQRTVSFSSNAAKNGGDTLDAQKRVARPALLKITSNQPDEEEATASLVRTTAAIAMSHSHLKPDEDVTIVVEEEC